MSVPLCQKGQDILKLKKDRRLKDSDLVFPGPFGGLLSDVGVNKVLHGMPAVARLDAEALGKSRSTAGRPVHGATVQGMRSVARSWAARKPNLHPSSQNSRWRTSTRTRWRRPISEIACLSGEI